jgi:hypothetical protein
MWHLGHIPGDRAQTVEIELEDIREHRALWNCAQLEFEIETADVESE